jgi:hypothetical protein
VEEEYLILLEAKKQADAIKQTKRQGKKTRREREREQRIYAEQESTRKASAFNNARAIKLLSVGQQDKFWHKESRLESLMRKVSSEG